MKEKDILHEIYVNLQLNGVYGKQVTDVRYPYFGVVLWKYFFKPCIGYCHYGSSAVGNNEEELEWLIKTIFEMKPSEFIKTYSLKKDGEY